MKMKKSKTTRHTPKMTTMEILEKNRPNDPYCDPLKEMEKLFGMAGAADMDVCYADDDEDEEDDE